MPRSNEPYDEESLVSESLLCRLVQLAEQGDLDAEQKLYCEYSPKLIRLASSRIARMFRAKIEAEDIVQSVFKSFFGKLQQGQLQLKSWDEIWALLVCMTLRKCNQKAKWMLRQKRDVRRELYQIELAESGRHLRSPEPTPLQVLLLEETVGQLLEPLSDYQRQIVLLKTQGYSIQQISDQIQRTRRTVYRALALARKQLVAMIDGDDEGVD